jgi:hypothetical protein
MPQPLPEPLTLQEIIAQANQNMENELTSQEYENRRFVIFDVTELPLIDFSQVFETSIDTVRKSVDETKTFVKYNMPQPSSVAALTTKSIEYTYDEILQILAGPEWTEPFPEPEA